MEGYHLSELIHRQAKKFGDEEVLKVRDNDTYKWSSVSWDEFSKKVMSVAQALCHFGVKPQSNVGIYTSNRAECFYVDFGAFANRAAVVPMYATTSTAQITYIINEAEIEILFVGEQEQYDKAHALFATHATPIRQLIILDSNVQLSHNDKTSIYFEAFISPKNRTSQDITSVEKRLRAAQDEDTAHIIYTSGTTGESKGVVLTHANYRFVMQIHDIRLDYLPQRYLTMSFLPMAHIFEKAWSIYCLHRGCSIAICPDPRIIQDCLQEVRPQAMCSVPRFWEKVYAGVQEKIDDSNWLIGNLFINAINTGEKYTLEYVNRNKKAPWGLRMKFKFYEMTVYKKLKKTIGIENGVIFPAAGSFLADEIISFLRAVNIPLVYGYGLTETTATVACYPHYQFEIGTVGKVMPEAEVRICENGEILVKADSVMKEYYKKPKATAAAFTEDGFFRTGDAGYLTEKQGIVLTDRLKDLYKTSNGKYIAPQQLESRLMADKYIDSAMVVGDQMKFVSALIIPDEAETAKYAKSQGVTRQSLADLYKDPKIRELFEQRIQALQADVAGHEQIKRFALLSEPFSIQTGELTNTLKMRRKVILDKYKDVIEQMYD
ncbi:MAG: long-chain fatty acid--CoA ligase [Candidatus Symbiothrix sp.]|jgi:long-chain acyl-CoA synthetase|nr:long-chain fatty acid--CoA ligase [Candidatus Symbiothrix sp.]